MPDDANSLIDAAIERAKNLPLPEGIQSLDSLNNEFIDRRIADAARPELPYRLSVGTRPPIGSIPIDEELSRTAMVRAGDLMNEAANRPEPPRPTQVIVPNQPPELTQQLTPEFKGAPETKEWRDVMGLDTAGQTMANAWDTIRGLSSYIGKNYLAEEPTTTLTEELGTPSRKPTTVEKALSGFQRSGVSLAEPQNVALMAAGGIPGIAGKAVNLYFLQDTIRNTAPLAQRAGEALAEGDVGKETEAITDLIINGLFATTAGTHALTPRHITEWKAQERGLDQYARATANWIVDNVPEKQRYEIYQPLIKAHQTQLNIVPSEQPLGEGPFVPTGRLAGEVTYNFTPEEQQALTEQRYQENLQQAQAGREAGQAGPMLQGGMAEALGVPMERAMATERTPGQPISAWEIRRRLQERSRGPWIPVRDRAAAEKAVNPPPEVPAQPAPQPGPIQQGRGMETFGGRPGETYEQWKQRVEKTPSDISYSATTQPAEPIPVPSYSKQINIGNVSGVDVLGLLGSLKATLYDKGIGYTVGKEVMQNAYDAIRGNSQGRIGIWRDDSTDQFGILDNGIGMSPMDVVTKFLPAGATGKNIDMVLGGGKTSGGFGLAKIALLGGTDEWELRTVGEYNGQKILTVVYGSGEDWDKFVQSHQSGIQLPINGRIDLNGIEIVTKIVSPDTPTGTGLSFKLPQAGGYESPAYNAFQSADEIGEKMPERVNFTRLATSDEPSTSATAVPPFGPDILPRLQGKYLYEYNPRSDTPKFNTMKVVDVPSARIEILGTPDGPRKIASGWSEIPVYNDGLYQFSMPMGVSDISIPNDLGINVISKVNPRDNDYPFTSSRDALRGTAREVATKELNTIGEALKRASSDLFRQTVEQAPYFIRQTPEGSVKTRYQFVDLGRSLPPELIREILNDQLLVRLVGLSGNWTKKLAKTIAATTGNNRYEHLKFIGFGTGDRFVGVNFGTTNPTVAKRNLIMLDPVGIFNDMAGVEPMIREGIYNKSQTSEIIADLISGTIIHEIAHQQSQSEGEQHAGIMTRILGMGLKEAKQLHDSIVREFTPEENVQLYDRLQYYSNEATKYRDAKTATSMVSIGKGGNYQRQASGEMATEIGGGARVRPETNLERSTEAVPSNVAIKGTTGEQPGVTLPAEQRAALAAKGEAGGRDTRYDDFINRVGVDLNDFLKAVSERQPELTPMLNAFLGKVNPELVFVPDVAPLMSRTRLTGESDASYQHRMYLIDNGGVAASYNLGENKIYSNKSVPDLGANVLHEVAHSGTLDAYLHDEGFRNEINKILEEARAKGGDFYGLTSGHEFLAEAYSNIDFQRYLNRLNLWQRLVNAVMKFFGIDPKYYSLLDQTMRLTNEKIRPLTEGEGSAASIVTNPKREEILSAIEKQRPGEGKELIRTQAAAEPVGQLRDVQDTIADLKLAATTKLPVNATPEQRLNRDVSQAMLSDPIVKQHILPRAEGVMWAADKLQSKIKDWHDIVNNPNVSPVLKSRMTKDTVESFRDFETRYAGWKADEPKTRKEFEDQLQAAMEGKDYHKTQKEINQVLWDDFIDAGRAIVDASGDRAAISTFWDFVKKPGELGTKKERREIKQVGRDIVYWMSQNLDWDAITSGVPKNTDDFMKLVDQAAKRIDKSKPTREVIGASDEAIRYVADLVMRSEPLREDLFQGSQLIKDKAANYPIGSAMQEIAKAVEEGKYQKAEKLMANGIGKTVIEQKKTRDALNFFAGAERKAIVKLSALSKVSDLLESIRSSPQFNATREMVYSSDPAGLRVREPVDMWSKDNHYILPPINSKDVIVDAEGNTKPNNRVMIFGTSRDQVEQNKGIWQEWKAKAMDYLANPDDPEYSEAKAQSIKDTLNNFGWYDDPTVNPTYGREVPGIGLRIQNRIGDMFFNADEVPEYVAKYGAGQVADLLEKTMQIRGTAMEVGYQAWAHSDPGKKIALGKALDAHKMDFRTWNEEVWPYLAGSRQYFENPIKYNVGDNLPSGHKVMPEDMEVLQRDKDYEDQIIKKFTGQWDKNWSLLRDYPAAVVMENEPGMKIYRRPAHTGPDTLVRYTDSARSWEDEWRSNPTDRVNFLNRNMRILNGYVSGVSEFTFKHDYKFRPELSTIEHEIRAGNPLESFNDLIDRLYEKVNARLGEEGEEGLTKDDIARQVINEINGIFSSIRPGHEPASVKTEISVIGGSNPLNTPRGEQILPSAWYDYGTIETGQAIGFYAHGASQFFIQHLRAAEAWAKSLENVVKRFEDSGKSRGQTTKEQQAGLDFYDWGEAKRALQKARDYVNHLKAIEHDLNTINWSSAWLHGTGVGGSLPSWLLTTVGAYGLNRAGGTVFSALDDRALRGVSMWRTIGRDVTQSLPRMLLKMAAHKDNPFYILTKWAGGKALIGKVADTVGKMLDAERQRRLDAKDDGTIVLNDYSELLKSLLFSPGTAGKVTSRNISKLEKALTATFVAGPRAAAKLASRASVELVDRSINETIRPKAEIDQQDLEKRIRDYLPLHEQVANNEGRQIFDERGIPDLNNKSNLLSDKELSGRPGLNEAQIKLQAVRLRDFYRRKLGVNVDDLAWRYYRNYNLAKSQEQARGLPEGTLTSKVRLLDDAQMRQYVMARAAGANLAMSSINRPTGALRWGRLGRVGYTFMGWPIWASSKYLHDFTSYLSTQKLPDKVWVIIPALVATALGTAFVGSSMTSTVDTGKELLGRYGSQPTFGDAMRTGDPKQMALSALDGYANMIPGIGTLWSQLRGRTFKRGFDLNNQLVYLNFWSDVQKTSREIWQSGDWTLPMLKFMRRWSGGLGYGVENLPQMRGLSDISNARNLLIRGAGIQGMESSVKDFSSGTDATYTPATPLKNRLANAVGLGDTAKIQAAYNDLLNFYQGKGFDPKEANRRAYQDLISRHPLAVLKTKPTQMQLDAIMNGLTDNQREVVNRSIKNFDLAAQMFGKTLATTQEMMASNRSKTRTTTVPKPPLTRGQRLLRGIGGSRLNRIRNRRYQILGQRPPRQPRQSKKRTRIMA